MHRGILIPAALLICSLGCRSDRAPLSAAALDSIPLSCDGCGIQLSTKLLLGRDEDPLAIQIFSIPFVGSDGGYLVAPGGDLAQIIQYDSTGEWVGSVGRQGDGPGEYRMIRDLVVRPDRMLTVLDRRMTLLTQRLSLERASSLPPRLRAARLIALMDSRLLLNNYSAPGRPFWLFASNLSPIRAIGDSSDAMDSDELQYQLTADRNGGFWAAKSNYRYALEHYDREGNLNRRLFPKSGWFVPWQGQNGRGQDPHRVAPNARIGGIWLDSKERLWILGLVADSNWTASLPPSIETTREQQSNLPAPSEWRRMYDSIVEIVDSKTGDVLETRRYDGAFGGFSNEGLLWELVEEASGGFRIRLVQVWSNPDSAQS